VGYFIGVGNHTVLHPVPRRPECVRRFCRGHPKLVGFLMNRVATLTIALGFFWAQPLVGVEVYDSRSRDYLDIESDNPIEEGEVFEYWDEGSRTYQTGTVLEADMWEDGGDVRVQDDRSGDVRSFELEW